jgi:hypothetical protein
MTSAVPDGWTVSNFPACADVWTSLTADQQALALRLAAFTMYSLTGRQFGTVNLTLRPCNAPLLPPLYQTYPVNLINPWGTDEGGSYYPLYIYNGVWHNAGCRGINCCGATCEVELPRTVSITSVLVDNAAVDPTAYRVDNGYLLVRTDTACWPQCQDLDKNPGPGVTDTFVVNGVFGRTVPQEALDAASILACELAKAMKGQPCRLPQRMQSLTRQGVSVQFPGVNTYLDRGLTGLNEVDQVVVQFNPGRLAQSPKVFSMDVSPNRITTWP